MTTSGRWSKIHLRWCQRQMKKLAEPVKNEILPLSPPLLKNSSWRYKSQETG
jgi:hypothetical protein